MTVSVIVPTFNGGPWIREQLAALSNQTYAGDWELVVGDNGSTDETRALLESWRHRFPRLRLIDASEVRGQSHARNRAAREAIGDILLFTDQDDIVDPSWIALLVGGLSNSPIVTGSVVHFVDGRAPMWDHMQEPQKRSNVGRSLLPLDATWELRGKSSWKSTGSTKP